jgi:hypothetical protein
VSIQCCQCSPWHKCLEWQALTNRVVKITMLHTAGARAQQYPTGRGFLGQHFTSDHMDCPTREELGSMLVWLLLFSFLPFPKDHTPAHLLLCSSAERSSIQSSWQETLRFLPWLIPLLWPALFDVRVSQSSGEAGWLCSGQRLELLQWQPSCFSPWL